MKRRSFIKNTGALASAPLLLNGITVKSMSNRLLNTNCDVSDRVLVVIQLFGGNDGVNTFVPLNQYDEYLNLRPSIGLRKSTEANGYIDLDSTLSSEKQLGLHPVLTGMKSMYEDDMLSIIQGVGYPSMNKSHFAATDLWMSGSDSSSASEQTSTGWMGRYLLEQFPNISALPNEEMQDPPGIRLGDSKPALGFFCNSDHSVSVNLSNQNPNNFSSLISSVGGENPNVVLGTDYGDDLNFIINTLNSTNAYADRITQVYNNGSNSSTTYPSSSLAGQLKIVARLLAGGSKTKVFLLRSSFGFDTHAGQVSNSTDRHLGNHANGLADLSDSIKAFQDDLKLLGIDDKVLGTTLTEFGRKVTENGNLGTDHGTLAPMIVFGKACKSGVIGKNPNLSSLDATGALNNEDLQYDYRQVYTSLLQDWLGASSSTLAATYFDTFENQKVDIVDSSYKVNEECLLDSITDATNGSAALASSINISPNPAKDFVTIDMQLLLDYHHVEVSLVDAIGNVLIRERVSDVQINNELDLDVSNIGAGQYFIKVATEKFEVSKKLLIQK